MDSVSKKELLPKTGGEPSASCIIYNNDVPQTRTRDASAVGKTHLVGHSSSRTRACKRNGSLISRHMDWVRANGKDSENLKGSGLFLGLKAWMRKECMAREHL